MDSGISGTFVGPRRATGLGTGFRVSRLGSERVGNYRHRFGLLRPLGSWGGADIAPRFPLIRELVAGRSVSPQAVDVGMCKKH